MAQHIHCIRGRCWVLTEKLGARKDDVMTAEGRIIGQRHEHQSVGSDAQAQPSFSKLPPFEYSSAISLHLPAPLSPP